MAGTAARPNAASPGIEVKACPLLREPLAELDGSMLRWLVVAASAAKRAKVDPSKYYIQVGDNDFVVRVFFWLPRPAWTAESVR